MNTLQKIGLTIGAVALASLPFFMREKPRDELVDVLCRDVYESRCSIGSGIDSYVCHGKEYVLKNTTLLVIAYNDHAPLNELGLNISELHIGQDIQGINEKEGLNIKDPTPQTVREQRIIECKIVDIENKDRKSFSSEELQELESLARTDIHYRALEREIFDDVDRNGVTTSITNRLLINMPYNIRFLDDYLKVKVPLVKECQYHIDKKTILKVTAEVITGKIETYELFTLLNDEAVPNSKVIKGENTCELFEIYDYTPIDNPEDGQGFFYLTKKKNPIPQHRLEQLVEAIRRR